MLTRQVRNRFLPVREGVSKKCRIQRNSREFPPCTGGCIAWRDKIHSSIGVSSLYGRVYRYLYDQVQSYTCFLPVREGVSLSFGTAAVISEFPPCTGGCIGHEYVSGRQKWVSSLYGRVYRTNSMSMYTTLSFLPVREGISSCFFHEFSNAMFPPCTGGCIGLHFLYQKNYSVSSLYGRVYRLLLLINLIGKCFLPVREGVSLSKLCFAFLFAFPPCTGECIVVFHPSKSPQFVFSPIQEGVSTQISNRVGGKGFPSV